MNTEPVAPTSNWAMLLAALVLLAVIGAAWWIMPEAPAPARADDSDSRHTQVTSGVHDPRPARVGGCRRGPVFANKDSRSAGPLQSRIE